MRRYIAVLSMGVIAATAAPALSQGSVRVRKVKVTPPSVNGGGGEVRVRVEFDTNRRLSHGRAQATLENGGVGPAATLSPTRKRNVFYGRVIIPANQRGATTRARIILHGVTRSGRPLRGSRDGYARVGPMVESLPPPPPPRNFR